MINNQWGETLRTVVGSLRAQKLRSILTLIGVIVGTAVVAMVGAILTGLSSRVTNITEKNSPNVIYFTRPNLIGPSLQTPTADERQRKAFTIEDALAVAALSSPQSVSPQKLRGDYGPTANPPKITAGSRSGYNPLILGVWENYPEIISVPIANGRFFTETERRSRSSVAVIGSGIARQLFETDDPLNENVRIDGRLYRVIGVLSAASGEGIIGSDELDERVVYIPYETAAKFYPESNAEQTLLAVRAPRNRVDEVADEVTYLLRQRRGVPFNAPNDFGVNRAEQIFTLVNQIIGGLTLIVAPVALASLLVGGVGVMNIMLVSVRERTTEIGVRRAMGARRKDIRNQFLFEAVALTCVGGVIGIALGLVLAFLIRFFISFPAAVPVWAILAGVVASVGVGLLAGSIPAVRAARLDPVAAMRGD